MTEDVTVFLPRDALERIKVTGAGWLGMTKLSADNFYVISRIETATGSRVPVDIPAQFQSLRWDGRDYEGQWIRNISSELTALHLYLTHRPGAGIDWEEFRALLPGVSDPGAIAGLVIVHNPQLPDELREAGAPEFAAWKTSRGGVSPLPLEIEPKTLGISQLAEQWPVHDLADQTVMVIGCGSIGSAAADALAKYGIGRLELVDPDRYLWHNMVRHVLPPEYVGRRKVDALKDYLTTRWGHLQVAAHPLDVVKHAHLVRPLVLAVDLVLCAADGIAPRRVVSHVARWAEKPAILACVLHQGAVGEVIRLRPTPRFGCLLCFRSSLAERGALDAEADQELDYGTGFVHQPMTAVPPDLQLVGALAAKAAVGTILESRYGDHTQQLAGEHAVVGLRPTNDLRAPFDVKYAGEVRWGPIPPPRAHCPTCGTS